MGVSVPARPGRLGETQAVTGSYHQVTRVSALRLARAARPDLRSRWGPGEPSTRTVVGCKKGIVPEYQNSVCNGDCNGESTEKKRSNGRTDYTSP